MVINNICMWKWEGCKKKGIIFEISLRRWFGEILIFNGVMVVEVILFVIL